MVSNIDIRIIPRKNWQKIYRLSHGGGLHVNFLFQKINYPLHSWVLFVKLPCICSLTLDIEMNILMSCHQRKLLYIGFEGEDIFSVIHLYILALIFTIFISKKIIDSYINQRTEERSRRLFRLSEHRRIISNYPIFNSHHHLLFNPKEKPKENNAMFDTTIP